MSNAPSNTPVIRTVFMGSDTFSLPVLESLITHGPSLSIPVEVVGVVTQPDRPAGRGRRLAPGPVKVLALGHALPVLQPERVRRPEALESILSLQPQLIVVASFGQILPSRLLDAPRYACLNLHPSLLPLYRGPAPLAGPILAGDTDTGTTVMLMTAGMDEGPILAQERTPLGEQDTAYDLEARLGPMSARLLLDTLPAWLEGGIKPAAQDVDSATYTRLLRKEDGRIDWQVPALELQRRVRAYNPWPGAFTNWGDRRLRLLRAHDVEGGDEPGLVTGERDGAMLIGTGNGLLAVTQLQPAGGRAMQADAFMRGYPDVVGTILR